MKINVEIDNITKAQKIALEDMFRTWVYLGNIGSSRWTSFFADGDGDFRPVIKVDGEDAKFAPKELISDEMREEMWMKREYRPNEEYNIDFDAIAWGLNKYER